MHSFQDWECGSGVEHSLSMCEALVLIPSIEKKIGIQYIVYIEKTVLCVYTYMHICILNSFHSCFFLKGRFALYPRLASNSLCGLEHMTILLLQPPEC